MVLYQAYLKGVKEGRHLKEGSTLPPSMLKGDVGPLTDQVWIGFRLKEHLLEGVSCLDSSTCR